MQTNHDSILVKRNINWAWFKELVTDPKGFFKKKRRKYILAKPYFRLPHNSKTSARLFLEPTDTWTVNIMQDNVFFPLVHAEVTVTSDFNIYPHEWYDKNIKVVKVAKDKFYFLNFPPLYITSEEAASLYIVIKPSQDGEVSIPLRAMSN